MMTRAVMPAPSPPQLVSPHKDYKLIFFINRLALSQQTQFIHVRESCCSGVLYWAGGFAWHSPCSGAMDTVQGSGGALDHGAAANLPATLLRKQCMPCVVE